MDEYEERISSYIYQVRGMIEASEMSGNFRWQTQHIIWYDSCLAQILEFEISAGVM